MFRKKSQKQLSRSTTRSRQSTSTMSESFRRNNIVITKRQKELAVRQQSVTQRQSDIKKAQKIQSTKIKVAAISLGILALLLLYRMSISHVSVTSNASSHLSTAQLQQYESSILDAYQKHTVAHQSWLLDDQGLSDAVAGQFPEIEQITVSTTAPFSKTLHADIRFRKAVFTWRDASNTDQFVDKNGVLFVKNLDPSVDTGKLIRIEDQSGVVLQAGTSVLTTSLVQFVGQLHSKLPPLYDPSSTIARVIVPKSTREVQVQVSGVPYLIKFSSTRSLDEQVGELQSLVQFLKNTKATPSAYIDLRVPHKAFYK